MILALSNVTYVLNVWFKFLLLKFLYEYWPWTIPNCCFKACFNIQACPSGTATVTDAAYASSGRRKRQVADIKMNNTVTLRLNVIEPKGEHFCDVLLYSNGIVCLHVDQSVCITLSCTRKVVSRETKGRAWCDFTQATRNDRNRRINILT